MKDKELIVVSKLQARPSFETALENELQALASASATEPGCLLYAIHRDLTDASVFVLIQRWASREALDIHFITPHFLQHSLILSTLITTPPIISYLEAIGEGIKDKLD